ncbi:ATP-binding protein [Variovorax sp. J31P179]|uniref:ATP-binding protein n=1 Tax=Variovorax sp. J31P179 TaxID=3053508 RepID=UPI0025765904|nr:ATP-binding protein [Variovorax sp. J31P179]MDM0084853.1 ATP-binding protein [Variovorax sp. J31P179]
MSIRNRLLLLVFAVWLPSVAAFALLAFTTYQREAAAARDQVEHLANGLNTFVERELDNRAVMATTLAATDAVREGDLRRFHEEATAATRASGNWAFLVDPKAQLAHTLVPWDQTEPIPRPAGAPFETSEPAAYFSSYGPVLKKPVLGVLAPETNGDPPRYNVGVSFELSVIQEIVNHQKFPSDSVAAVIDQDHRVIARSRKPEEWVGKSATGDLKRRAQAGDVGFAESTTLDGVRSLTYLTRGNRYGWSVVFAFPMAALNQAAWRITIQAVAASGTLLLLGLALALYAARSISNPMMALRDAAAQLGKDEVPPKLTTGVSEADDVSAALHDAGLRSQDAKRTLEARVADAVEEAREAHATLLNVRKHEAIGRLTGGIAHDFNNLLQTISTGHQVLSRTVSEGPQQRVLQSAMRATAKAADLVRQLLTFGRAQRLAPQPVDIGDLVLKSQELTSKAVGERSVLSASIEPGLPAVFVDPTQLELAILNLVFNARDAMPDGGHVLIVGRLASAAETQKLGSGRFVAVEVSDDGPGMDADTAANAFEPYFTTKPIGAGSGLGLAQVLGFARQSGGDARIESRVNAGTRVSLYLPAFEGTIPVQETMMVKLRHAPPLKILMAEDDVLVSSVVVVALESTGHHVTLCRSAEDAVTALTSEQEFDVLFTDVVMTGKMTGLDLLSWCRIHRPSLPAVVATGYSAQETTLNVTMLRKPYGVEALLEALQQAFEKEHPPDTAANTEEV